MSKKCCLNGDCASRCLYGHVGPTLSLWDEHSIKVPGSIRGISFLANHANARVETYGVPFLPQTSIESTSPLGLRLGCNQFNNLNFEEEMPQSFWKHAAAEQLPLESGQGDVSSW